MAAGVAVAAMCALGPVIGVEASTVLTPPYASTFTDTTPPCTLGDAVEFPSGGMPLGTCTVTTSSSASTGDMSGTLLLQSPVSGTVAWSAAAYGDTGVNAVYHLASPTPQLDITVTFHVNSAAASINRSLPGVPPAITDSTASIVDNSIIVGVSASAREAQCSPNCAGGSSLIVAGRFLTGTTSVSGQDLSAHFVLANGCSQGILLPPTPCDLPAGDVVITPIVYLYATQLDSWGTATGQIDAVATSITIG